MAQDKRIAVVEGWKEELNRDDGFREAIREFAHRKEQCSFYLSDLGGAMHS